MLTRVTGVLERLEGQAAVVAPDGVGLAYEVLLPAVLADDLAGAVGERVTLHLVEHLEQQSQGASFVPRRIGFLTLEQRRFFELFTTVKGVGPRKAVRCLTAPFERIARAIVDRDTKFLQTMPEIGKRLAETIALDLHEKAGAFALEPPAGAGEVEPKPGAAGAGPLADGAAQAVEAMVTLGETRSDAETLVRRALRAEPAPEGADAILAAAFSLRS